MTAEELLRQPETANFIASQNPGYSRCAKCKLPWTHCKSKKVHTPDGKGCFAMCTYCWDRATLDEKITHYKALWYEGARWTNIKETTTIEELEQAVIEEHNKTVNNNL